MAFPRLSPIPVPVAVPIPFPIPIAIPVQVRPPTVAGDLPVRSIGRNPIMPVNILHPFFHAAHFTLVVRSLIVLPAREIAVKTTLIVSGKLPSTPLRERGSQQD